MLEAVCVLLGVHDGVSDGVRVKDAVSVAGWKGVNVSVEVPVFVGVKVNVGVLLAVLVKITGVGLNVAVSVMVAVGVTVGVKLPGEGANVMAMNPMQ